VRGASYELPDAGFVGKELGVLSSEEHRLI